MFSTIWLDFQQNDFVSFVLEFDQLNTLFKLNEIWHVMDVIVVFHSGQFLAILPH